MFHCCFKNSPWQVWYLSPSPSSAVGQCFYECVLALFRSWAHARNVHFWPLAPEWRWIQWFMCCPSNLSTSKQSRRIKEAPRCLTELNLFWLPAENRSFGCLFHRLMKETDSEEDTGRSRRVASWPQLLCTLWCFGSEAADKYHNLVWTQSVNWEHVGSSFSIILSERERQTVCVSVVVCMHTVSYISRSISMYSNLKWAQMYRDIAALQSSVCIWILSLCAYIKTNDK